jgi:broad specificity phosphatase PhoE
MVKVMRAEGRGKRVLVVTSGGPISVMARLPLSIAAGKTAAIMFELDNASLTELRYTEDRLSLARFNTVAHLSDELITRI